jgi:hypothetical protein
MVDVLYSEFCKLWGPWKSHADQAEFAVGLIRRALLKFDMKWTLYKNHCDFNSAIADQLFRSFADMFIDISVEVSEILPAVFGSELFKLSIVMADAANRHKSGISIDEIRNIYSEVEKKTHDFYSNLVEYSEKVALKSGDSSKVSFTAMAF